MGGQRAQVQCSMDYKSLGDIEMNNELSSFNKYQSLLYEEIQQPCKRSNKPETVEFFFIVHTARSAKRSSSEKSRKRRKSQ